MVAAEASWAEAGVVFAGVVDGGAEAVSLDCVKVAIARNVCAW